MITFFYVILGGGIGSGLRYMLSKSFSHILIFNIPIIILTINIIGSFIMGIVFQYANQNELSENLKLFLTAGILGSYTTFSTFSLEAYQLMIDNKITEAIIYITASVLISLIALYLGIIFIKR